MKSCDLMPASSSLKAITQVSALGSKITSPANSVQTFLLTNCDTVKVLTRSYIPHNGPFPGTIPVLKDRSFTLNKL
jgi:hypothetical protein